MKHSQIVSAGFACLFLECVCGGLFVQMLDGVAYRPVWEAHVSGVAS